MPDLADQQVLGVLPVRTRTVAAARLFAAMSVGIVFAVAIAMSFSSSGGSRYLSC